MRVQWLWWCLAVKDEVGRGLGYGVLQIHGNPHPFCFRSWLFKIVVRAIAGTVAIGVMNNEDHPVLWSPWPIEHGS